MDFLENEKSDKETLFSDDLLFMEESLTGTNDQVIIECRF